jgi:hypothetical protein
MIGLDYSSMIQMTPETLYTNMQNTFKLMNDKDAFNLVKNNYKIMLSDIFDKKERKETSNFIKYFTDSKFLSIMTQVMYTETPDEKSKRRLNKMCFDYIVLQSKNKDQYIVDLISALSRTINRDIIPILCTIPLSESMAATIALSRYSSEKENINIKRLNKVLMNQPLGTLDEEKIVNIYLKLFDHVLPLFTGVMLDVQSPQNMSSDAEEIYGMITLAMLDIMNELPIGDIKKGLKLFNEDRKILYPDSPLRMNLKCCSETDFPRFVRALDELELEGIIIDTR